MALRVYNTLTRKKEDFKAVADGKVSLYVCGVTVYDHCHVGHARSAIVFDVMVRYLASRGYDVTSVKNFTDIDDKILRKAQTEGISWKEVGEKYITSFYEDMGALNILRPTYEPRATDHIDEMIALVDTLLAKGHAYVSDGDVYFSVDSFKSYGQLSKRSLDEMLAGARVDVNERKQNPLDFALWKASKAGEPSWDAPFGSGRPGWHIECSVMSTKYLGNPFDIHGGGKDLVFPHHENERAQTEAATGRHFVNYWIHNGFVNVEKEKMSKSIGNILLIKEFLKEYHPDTLRLFFLGTHYRNPVDYTTQSVEDTQSALRRLYATKERISEIQGLEGVASQPFAEADTLVDRFHEAMDDDFNTALALSYLFEMSKTLNRLMDEPDESVKPLVTYTNGCFTSLASVLGLLSGDPKDLDSREKGRHLARVGLDEGTVKRLIAERGQARKERNFQRADEVRDLLLGKGILLLDTPKGTEWRIKSSAGTKGEN